MKNLTTLCYLNAVKRLKLPFTEHKGLDGFELHIGKKSYFFFKSYTPINPSSAGYICKNKYTTLGYLNENDFPVRTFTFTIDKELVLGEAEKKIKVLPLPLRIYPVDENPIIPHISGDISLTDVKSYIQKYKLSDKYILLESLAKYSHAYQALIYKKKVIGLIETFPAEVIGDGQSSIEKLIEKENSIRDLDSNYVLKKIIVTNETKRCLTKQHLSLDAIPSSGQKIILSIHRDIQQGANYKPVPISYLSESIKKTLIKTKDTLGLELASISFDSEKLSDPLKQTAKPDIEIYAINSAPLIEFYCHQKNEQYLNVTDLILKTFIKRPLFNYLLYLIKQK